VLVVDETGDLKKGTQTVGVQRQYTGTAGRVENAQVAVLLTYASQAEHGVIDRELYVPRSWTRDRDRLRAAGVPRSGAVCDQARPGHGHARPCAGRGRASQLGHR
jgi:SRSO17 transposase